MCICMQPYRIQVGHGAATALVHKLVSICTPTNRSTSQVTSRIMLHKCVTRGRIQKGCTQEIET